MRGQKRHTTQTYTKRVDHEAGRHRPERALPEPAVCEICGEVYAGRRWSKPELLGAEALERATAANPVVCPACRREREGVPSGYVHLTGKFLAEHKSEIERLLINEAERAGDDNPMARVMNWATDRKGRLTLTTTTEHLAQRLGHALEKAYDGNTRYDFSHENKLARVYWRRD